MRPDFGNYGHHRPYVYGILTSSRLSVKTSEFNDKAKFILYLENYFTEIVTIKLQCDGIIPK